MCSLAIHDRIVADIPEPRHAPDPPSLMQLSIPSSVLTANQDVFGALQRASVTTKVAQSRVDGHDTVRSGARQLVVSALADAQQAVEGVEALGKGNLLDGTFQRYANHSVRHLQRAADMLARPGQLSADAKSILSKVLFDAEVSTRLGTEAGARSLAKPSPKALERATEFSGGGDTSSSSGPVWVDGQWLDGLGNPVRGGGGYTGPDGDSFGWDGAPDRGDGGGYTGPDGETYSGI